MDPELSSARRLRHAAWVIASTLAVGSVAGSAAADSSHDATRPHLPTVVNAPGAWSGVGEPHGRVAAMGLSTRRVPRGMNNEAEKLQFFATSASDGRSVWIKLPGEDPEDRMLVDWFALSPDGRWIGWGRGSRRHVEGDVSRVTGWSVMDTVTGHVHRLDVPTDGDAVENYSELSFSGDSRYLQVSYDSRARPERHYFVAFDVKTGAASVLEKPGSNWLPNVGSAPHGVTWARGRTVYRQDPAGGPRRSFEVSGHVVEASWSPNDRSFAYIGRKSVKGASPGVLHAGRSVAEARRRAIPLRVEPGELLGWRDDTHVVVGHYRKQVRVVDVVSGRARTIDMAGQGEIINTPLLASALWREKLQVPLDPTGTSDPRRPHQWGAGLVLLLAAGWLLAPRWSRRRARR